MAGGTAEGRAAKCGAARNPGELLVREGVGEPGNTFLMLNHWLYTVEHRLSEPLCWGAFVQITDRSDSQYKTNFYQYSIMY